MLVATYWAECRLQQRLPAERPGRTRRRVTVRRLGWSNDSRAAAQAMAEARAQHALAQRLSGVESLWCEPRVAYNGAEGVPIREERLASQGEAVLTRNVYGARCLNTAEVLFADIDFPTRAPGRWWGLGALPPALLSRPRQPQALARMPRSGVWPPQDPARLPSHQAWVAAYEAASPAWAACRALATLGPAAVHPVLDWHDTLSQAHSGLPLA